MIVATAFLFGAIAQLGERLLCKQEVVGSIPSGSTRDPGVAAVGLRGSEFLEAFGFVGSL